MSDTKQQLRGGQYVVWLASSYQPINFALTARVRGTFTPEEFQKAAGKLQLKYPQLSMRVAEETKGKVYLVPDATLKLPVRIVERRNSENWVEEVTAELTRSFDMLADPPVRFVWLRGEDVSEIIFVCPHALADGYAVAFLARDLLSYLGNPASAVEALPLTPTMSDLIPDFPGKRMAVWQAGVKTWLMQFFIGRSANQKAQAETDKDSARPTYYLQPWELTPAQTSALVARSRAENTTVHAALCVAFLRAFGEFYGSGWRRRLQSPISLRDRLTTPVGESFGLFVNLVEFPVDCAPQRNFWEVARGIKQNFLSHTQDKYVFASLIEAKVATDRFAALLTPEFAAKSVMKIKYDLSITNLGRLAFPLQYGQLQLEALYGPALGGSPEDIVLGVITIRDKMHFTLSYTDLKLKPSQAEQIIERAMQRLAEAAGW